MTIWQHQSGRMSMTLEDIIKTVYIRSEGYRPEHSPYYLDLSQQLKSCFLSLSTFSVSLLLILVISPWFCNFFTGLVMNKGIFFATLKLFLVSRCLGERSAIGILSLTQVVCTIVILTNIVFILFDQKFDPKFCRLSISHDKPRFSKKSGWSPPSKRLDQAWRTTLHQGLQRPKFL